MASTEKEIDYIFFYFLHWIVVYNLFQPNLGAREARKFLLSSSPLADQKRNVEKLDQLLPLCDGLTVEE